MIDAKSAFSGFSVDNLVNAKNFYTGKLGLKLDSEEMGLDFSLPNDSGRLFIYQKDDHLPAAFTVLNFVVDNIDDQVEELKSAGVEFEQYDFGGGAKTDEAGIMRGLAADQGPDIAWFKDPAGNVLSLLQPE